MNVDMDTLFSMTDANQNFNKISKKVKEKGKAIILKNNKPELLVIDINNPDFILNLSDDERFEIVSKRILNKYLPAFKELAK